MRKYFWFFTILLSTLLSQYFDVNIENTGKSSLIIIQEEISGLQQGDEIGIFDADGVIETSESGETTMNGEVLIGAGIWENTQLEITAIASVDMSQFNGPILAGYVVGNPIIVKVWKQSEGIEYIVSPEYTNGDGSFGQLITTISDFTQWESYGCWDIDACNYSPDTDEECENCCEYSDGPCISENPNDWSINPPDFENNGSLTSGIFINNIQSGEQDDILLAYVENEIRGIANGLEFPLTGEIVFLMMLYSNNVFDEEVHFLFYDNSASQLYHLNETIEFVSDMIIGDGYTPFEFHLTVENYQGCTDIDACNFESATVEDDGSCVYPVGCNDWCDGDNDEPQYLDCTGECGGNTEIDSCGECDGDDSSCDFPEVLVSFGDLSGSILVNLDYIQISDEACILNPIFSSNSGEQLIVQTGECIPISETTGTLSVYMGSAVSIGGFQFEMTGVQLTNGWGGSASNAGMMISTSDTVVLAFSFTGSQIDADLTIGCWDESAENYDPNTDLPCEDCCENTSVPGCDFYDCEGECVDDHESWLGDGYCDDGTSGIDFNCEAFNWDNGDCESDGGGGGNNEIFECRDGSEIDVSLICNGSEDCPDGSDEWICWGDWYIDDSYEGDCSEYEGLIEDCDEQCFPETLLGDGFCDDGSWTANFNCESLNWDNGDCDSEEPEPEDCDSDTSTWIINPPDFENNGSVTIAVSINNEIVGSETDIVVGFVNDEVRGVQTALLFPPTETWVFNLMLFSNEVSGETVTFKYYNSTLDHVFCVDETLEFVSDMTIGNALDPFMIEISLEEIYGCMDPEANNYNPQANIDDGSCEYPAPDLFQFNQSTLIAFYFFEEIFIDSTTIETQDWVGAYKGDLCVGARRISACGDGACDIPIMGDDGEEYSAGYMTTGEYPTFKIYDASENEYLDAYPSEEVPWQSLSSPIIDFLTTVPVGTPDCSGVLDGNAVVDDCDICICGDEINENCVEQDLNADMDCTGECFGDAQLDDCGVCSGDNSTCTGCMEIDACNYDEFATLPSDCEYPETGFNCEGECIIGEDCNGVCGGSAEIDDCGVCEGENADQDCAGECFGSNICGCSDELACNFDSEVTFDDGSCFYEGCDETQYYQVNIEETGQSQLTIFENTITSLDIFDEIGIFDLSGVTETNEDCDESHNGEVLVGAGLWTGTQLEIVSTGSVDMCEFSGPQLAGYIDGHPLVARVYDISEDIEYETSLTFSTGSGTFGELLIAVSEITLINTELEHFDVTINETGMSSLIILEDSISILEQGDEIALFDTNGIVETDSTGQNVQYGEVIVGAGYWIGSQLPIVAIGSVDMTEFNGPALAGYIDGNPIKARIWDASENEEFEVTLTFSAGNGLYGEALTAVSGMEIIPQYNIVINEFFFRPTSGTSVPDYVELLNLGNESVDLTGWQLDGEIISSGTIEPNSFFLLAGEDPFFNVDGEGMLAGDNIPNSAMVDFNLSTSSDEIELTTPDGSLMDIVSYNVDFEWPVGNSFRGHAVELTNPWEDNNIASNWESAPETLESWLLFDEDGEILNYGTPSEENSVFIPPIDDCSGVPNGSAFIDDCGVCICGDEVNESCLNQEANADLDCTGECFGDAFVDDCGVCDGNNADMDCAGECFGSAQLTIFCSDNDGDGLGQPGTETEFCDANVGENWVEDCSDQDDGCESNYYDCAGICDGLSQEDNCDVCDDDPSNDCVQDCNGEWGGDAQLDDCGVCDGNNADDLGCGCFEPAPQFYYEDSDGDGLGFGEGVEYCANVAPEDWVTNSDDEHPNCTSNVVDCEGVCDGISYEDNCGYCDDNSSNDCIQDCSGEWGGTNICGCADEYADNFNDEATFDDGSCEYTQPENFNYNSSTQMAFYYFMEVFDIHGELIQPNDWVGAFRNGVCVGSRRWDTTVCNGGVCDIPVLGNDGSEETIGYMLTGEFPTFQIYDSSEEEYYFATPSSIVPWQQLENPVIDELIAESILGNDPEVPSDIYLGQSYPNPFNPVTSIDFGLNVNGQIKISVFDLTGREVGTLEQGYFSQGEYTTQWDAGELTSGIYLIKLFSQNQVHTRKVVLIK